MTGAIVGTLLGIAGGVLICAPFWALIWHESKLPAGRRRARRWHRLPLDRR